MSRSESPEVTYDTTTPAKPVARKTAAVRKPASGRAAAGPSKRAANPPKRSKAKKQSPGSSDAEVGQPEQEHIDIPSGSEEEQPPPPPKAPAKKPLTRVASVTQLNGKPPAKGKGKAKEIPEAKSQGEDGYDALMDVDYIQDLTTLPDGEVSKPPDRTSKSTGRSVKDADYTRTQKQLQQSQKQVESLKKQLEDLLKTQAEQSHALDDWKAQQEDTAELFKSYRKEIEQIQRSTPNSAALTLHFLTREDADKEQAQADKEIGALKQKVKAKDIVISEKDKIIAELKANEKILQSDLNAEIERAKSLTKFKPAGHARGLSEVPFSIETHKKSAATRLYEDITNILVINLRTERNAEVEGETDVIISCMYTHGGELEVVQKRSLNFTLRSYWEMKDNVKVENVKYTPQDLDKESAEFKERLEFLGDTFTFERHQIQVFYEQLRDHVAGAIEQEGSEGGSREVIDLQDDDDGEDLYA